MTDLHSTNREALIQLVSSLLVRVGQLEARVGELEEESCRLRAGQGGGTPLVVKPSRLSEETVVRLLDGPKWAGEPEPARLKERIRDAAAVCGEETGWRENGRNRYLWGPLKEQDRYFEYGPAKAKLNLLLWWEPQQPEPWLIATTLSAAEETKRSYWLRTDIEEMFKDLKQTFALESCQCQSMDRITRLGLFALVSLWALARLVRFPEAWVRYVTARGAPSFLTLALEWLDAPPHLRRSPRQKTRCG